MTDRLEETQEQNQAGQWVPAIPEPFYGRFLWAKWFTCRCGMKFTHKIGYRKHYAYHHIHQGWSASHRGDKHE